MAESDDKRLAERADELLPEEEAAGSDDPAAQAAAILEDSDRREATREADPGDQEHRSTTD